MMDIILCESDVKTASGNDVVLVHTSGSGSGLF
jgi:hypothetical protein